MHYEIKYRSEIDGLRALAVLPVILFHAGFTGFSGGYVGVDVFFVISGYLITSILLKGWVSKSFSLVKFYERRIRRILPALYFVLVVSCLFAWVWLTPREMKDFSKSVLHTISFSSNFFFNRTTDYFDKSIDFKPLIHTWSLSVEEQYYMVFPLLLGLALWASKQRFWIYLLILFVLSFGTSQVLVYTYPTDAFYLLPTRAWELLLGALVSAYEYKVAKPKWHGRLKEAVSALGLLLILVSVFLFNDKVPTPSAYTLLPTLGAALIIVFAHKRTLTGSLLGSKPFVYVGLLSYSAYLWHQPVFAFSRQLSIFEPSALLMLALTVLTFCCAFLSWRYVERPFRNNNLFAQKQVFAAAIFVTLALAIFGYFGKETDGYEFRFDGVEKSVLDYENYKLPTVPLDAKGCSLDLNFDLEGNQFSEECMETLSTNSIIVLGDSHAHSLSYGIRNAESSTVAITSHSCPPLFSIEIPWNEKCFANNVSAKDAISKLKPKYLILHANWLDYLKLISEETLLTKVAEAINILKAESRQSSIIVVGPVPQYRPSLPEMIVQKNAKFKTGERLLNSNASHFSRVDEALAKVSAENRVAYISAINTFCDSTGCRVFIDGERPILTSYDYGHLTLDGADFLAKAIVPKIH